MPRRPMRRSSSRSTRWTSRTPIRTASGRNCSATTSSSRRWAARRRTCEVSATKKTGLDKLIEAILLQAEILDLKSNPNRTAEGTVIESRLDRGRGPVGTVLVQRGTLKQGDIVVAGVRMGPGARDARRQGPADGRGRSVRAGGNPRPERRARRPASRSSWSRTKAARARSPSSANAASATRSPARRSARAARWTRCWRASRPASRRKSRS